jgi:hypothetical protein
MSEGPLDNLVVSRAGQEGSSFITYGGAPDEHNLDAYGKLVPGLRYTMLLAVPFGRAVEDHDLAFSFGEWLADEYDGIVYAPDLDEVVWPESRRGERAELLDDPDFI